MTVSCASGFVQSWYSGPKTAAAYGNAIRSFNRPVFNSGDLTRPQLHPGPDDMPSPRVPVGHRVQTNSSRFRPKDRAFARYSSILDFCRRAIRLRHLQTDSPQSESMWITAQIRRLRARIARARRGIHKLAIMPLHRFEFELIERVSLGIRKAVPAPIAQDPDRHRLLVILREALQAGGCRKLNANSPLPTAIAPLGSISCTDHIVPADQCVAIDRCVLVGRGCAS